MRSGGAEAAAATGELKRVRVAASDLALELDAALGRMNSLEAALKEKDAQLKAELERFDAERKQMQVRRRRLAAKTANCCCCWSSS